MQVNVYTSSGRAGGKIKLPEEIFGQKTNMNLIAQAVRVYQWQAKRGRAQAQTRAEVSKTGAKVWRQKGTGRARHGSRRAPIFVGGGVAHGPKVERRNLRLSKKMARVALHSALSGRASEGKISIIDVSNIAPKTKEVAGIFSKITGEKPTLVLHAGEKDFMRAARNLPNLKLTRANNVNAYEIVKFGNIVITREGVALLA